MHEPPIATFALVDDLRSVFLPLVTICCRLVVERAGALIATVGLLASAKCRKITQFSFRPALGKEHSLLVHVVLRRLRLTEATIAARKGAFVRPRPKR